MLSWMSENTIKDKVRRVDGLFMHTVSLPVLFPCDFLGGSVFAASFSTTFLGFFLFISNHLDQIMVVNHGVDSKKNILSAFGILEFLCLFYLTYPVSQGLSLSSIFNIILVCSIWCNLGFNCGEAANFGTPEWLKVAKEAAVRRAAMNYLPMLSHQQLLYLLTMSFISR